jgi:predicted secreted hydrolase
MDVLKNRTPLRSALLTRRSVLGGGLMFGMLGSMPGFGLAASSASALSGGQRKTISGIPLFVDPAKDLPRHTDTALESWYVNAAFESRGKVVGFEWHQGVTLNGSATEFLLMNGTDGIWQPHVAVEPPSATAGASTDECHVYSSLGTLKGDYSGFQLKLASGKNSVDVVLKPKGGELYNGTTGLLPLLGSNSYEYAFTNMSAQGSMVIDGETYPVLADSVWFDRQWGKAESADPVVLAQKAAAINEAHWTWLGMAFGAGEKSAISFWDIMEPSVRWTALTYLREDGVQMNVGAEIQYDRIWTSKDTGQRYPSVAHIVAPAIDLDIVLTAMLERPEFIYAPGSGHSGCQSLCNVTGKIGKTVIQKPVILEMIGGIDV